MMNSEREDPKEETMPLEMAEQPSASSELSTDVSVYTITPRERGLKWYLCCFWNRNGFVLLQEEHEALRSEFAYQQKVMKTKLEVEKRNNERKEKEIAELKRKLFELRTENQQLRAINIDWKNALKLNHNHILQNATSTASEPDITRLANKNQVKKPMKDKETTIKPQSVIIVGGYNGKNRLNSIEVYNPDKPTENRIISCGLQTARCYHTAALLSDKMYVLGGYQGDNSALKSTEVIDIVRSEWLMCGPEMTEEKEAFASATINNKLMIFGGFGMSSGLRSCEILNPVTESWSPLPDMPRQRWGHNAVELNGKVYLIGGRVNGAISQLVSIFDPETASWHSGLPTTQPRYCAAAVKFGSTIVVTGGLTDGPKTLTSCEILDPRKKGWMQMTPLLQKRDSHVLVNYNGQLLAMGGVDDRCNCIDFVEQFEPRFNRWFYTQPIKMRRCGFAAVVAQQ